MPVGALLFAAFLTASGYFLYRKARPRYGIRIATSMLQASHVRTLTVEYVTVHRIRREGN